MKQLPGWTSKIDEVSNGVFKVELTDNYGRKVEVIDNATDATIERAYSAAFDIEKKVSRNWSKFLYDLCISELNDTIISSKAYNGEDWGSWLVEIDGNRIIYMGKEFWLVAQLKKENKWFDKSILTKDELTYRLFLSIVNAIR